jgi:starch-binding outer membrane protein, SusD/RagB family
MTNRFRTGGRPTTRRFATLGVVAALTFSVACDADQILDVEDIDVASPESVSDPTALPAVLAGAVGDFGAAYNGGGDFNQITLAGQLSDELYNTETFPTRIENDQRRQQYQSNGSLSNLFYSLQQARASADRAADGYVRLERASDVGLAEALNLSALSYILMAENYCNAVPISTLDANGNFVFGSALTGAELLNAAVRKADSAFANATAADGEGDDDKREEQALLARIVKARALLNLNQPADAAAAIGGEAGVPTTFQYNYTHSETTARQNNGTWGVTVSVARFGVPDREGTNGLPFLSEGDLAGTVNDPRVANTRRTANSGRGFDNATIQYMQQKYPARPAPVTIADGVEARLIEAEAALRAGNSAGALAILNALRSDDELLALRGYDAGSLAPLAAAGSEAAQVDQLFKERAYWLFLTSHRLGDLRRLVRQYSRDAESVFPTGSYHKSGTYGTDVNTPIPQAEDNNPNFQRAGCVTTEA